MPSFNHDQEKIRQGQELKIWQQIAFASGLFQGDVTVRTLLGSLPVGCIILDNSGTILLVNDRAEQMFGYPKEDLMGKPHAVLIPERFRKVHEEHMARFFAEFGSMPMNHCLDVTGRRRDESEFPVEINLGSIETVNGVHFLAFVSDITIRKQLEMRLRETEEMFHLQIEQVRDYAIFAIDPQGIILNWNVGAEHLKGYCAEEIVGRHFSCFYTEEDRNAGKPEAEIKMAAAEGQVTDEGWRIRKDGSKFWADVIITALHGSNGNLLGFSKVTHDISERKQVEQSLQESEEEYRTVADFTYDWEYWLAPDQRLLYCSPSCLRITGYRREEFIADPGLIAAIIYPEDRQRLEQHLNSVCAMGTPSNELEYRITTRSGDIRWIGHACQDVYGGDGVYRGRRASNRDITEGKRVEEELKESDRVKSELLEKLNQAQQLAMVGSWDWDLKTDRVWWSDETYRIFGVTQQDYIPSFEANSKFIHPDDLERYRTAFESSFQTGKLLDLNIRLVISDGQLKHCVAKGTINYDNSGQPIRFVGTIMDITERKQAEREANRNRVILEEAEKLARVGGWEWDFATNRFHMSQGWLRIHGSDDPNPSMENLMLVAHPEDRAAVAIAFKDAFEKGIHYQIVHRIVRPSDGEVRIIQAYGAVIKNGPGEPVRMYGAAQDITEHKRAEENILRLNANLMARSDDLENANRELETFNYTVAHDLRNPLNVISLCCQTLITQYGDQLQEECGSYVQEAYKSSLLMNQLIETLLNFSRMSKYELSREILCLSLLAHEVVDELKQAEPERQVDFRIADGIVANGDATLLRVVLNNLFGNAWKYTAIRKKAVIEFGVTDLDWVPTYFVRDNGAGFDMKDADKIFIPFQRLAGAEKCKGFGIGLATVERIIMRHGGRIWAEGEADKGSCFCFTLSTNKEPVLKLLQSP